MKTQEQIEKALKKYEEMLEDNKHKMGFELQFIEGSTFMEDKITYADSVRKYHEAEKNMYACEKLIKNCKWILDIE